MITVIQLLYLLSAVLFIIGIKMMNRIPTARTGNQIGAVGMFIAVLATLIYMQHGDPSLGIAAGSIGWTAIIGGLVLGGLIGVILAKKVSMTQMPEFVALFNGFGGAASALVVGIAFFTVSAGMDGASSVSVAAAGLFIGVVTFTGSMAAFFKLNGTIPGRPVMVPGYRIVTILLLLASIVTGAFLVSGYLQGTHTAEFFIALILISAILGVALILPIGGADMPVVISLFNAYSGIAGALTGFVLHNPVLIISGALVGASGIILTRTMCKAMNRSLVNVLLGGFGNSEVKQTDHGEYTSIKEVSAAEAALMFDGASSVIIVPGYGMAVSQAQYAIEELMELLTKKNTTAVCAIHPVAGRMPGHMNVLLAEASIPYEKLKDLDQITAEFKRTDVVYVVGANDVVNPAASNDPGSPMYGMPILPVHEAKSVIIVKRGLSAGFAGVKNDLFEYPNAVMLFDDAKKATEDIVGELKNL